MSFTWVAVGTVVATAAYSADQQRKGIHAQQDALRAAQEEDARKAAEAETSAQVAANASLAEAKRRRRTSALSLGDPTGTGDTTLGGSGASMTGGGPSSAARAGFFAPAAVLPVGTVLGAGAPASTVASGRVTTPRTPARAQAV